MSTTHELKALLDAADPRIINYLGQPDPPPETPYRIIDGGAGIPERRALTGHARDLDVGWWIRCVNNTREGAAIVAALAIDALDGCSIDGRLVRVPFVAEPIEDDGNPAEYRYSVTVEVRSNQRRQND
jgi:hypothetical protein